MRTFYGDIDWDNDSLEGITNMPLDFFNELPENLEPLNQHELHQDETPANEQAFYVYEDPSSRRPLSMPLGDLVDFSVIINAVELKERQSRGREPLPIDGFEDEIIDAIVHNPVVIIKAETGAGKSTQVDQMIARRTDHRVRHTHPRKVAARNVDERQVYELGIVHGEDTAREMVATRMRGEAVGPDTARITHYTDGLELALQIGMSDNDEREVVVVDEAHEQNTNMEFLLGELRLRLSTNPNLKVVIMSADIDIPKYSAFFADCTDKPVPVIEVPGRAFPVERLERPHSTVVDEAILAATKLHTSKAAENGEPNGILIFQPGVREIDDTVSALENQLPKSILANAHIFKLHSKMSPRKQQEALQTYDGISIIVSTNIAETSLTIPALAYVVDSGMKRQTELDDEGGQGLVLTEISKAECNQRAGRAGRVSAGTYILTRPNSEATFVPIAEREAYQTPEIFRTDITRNTLRFAAGGRNLIGFKTPNEVQESSVLRAQEILRMLGALDEDNTITERGLAMDRFSVSAPLARSLLEVGRYNPHTQACMAAIAACKEVGFLQDFNAKRDREKDALQPRDLTSDLLTQLEIFVSIQDMNERELEDRNIEVKAAEDAKNLYKLLCRRLDIQPGKLTLPSDQQRSDLRQCIGVGGINNIFMHLGGGKYKHVGSSEYIREFGKRTVTKGNAEFVTADRWRGILSGQEKHVLEGVTFLTAQEVARIAVEKVVWRSEGYFKKDGLLYDRQRANLFETDIRQTREVRAEPSPRLRAELLRESKINPGSHQLALRALKRELEELAHLTQHHVPQLTQDMLEDWLDKCAPADVVATWTIDNNLGQFLLKHNIGRSLFVEDARVERIKASAPDVISTGDVTLQVSYQSGVPIIRQRHYSKIAIAKIQHQLCLQDGREVLFVHDGKRKTLYQMQAILGIVN